MELRRSPLPYVDFVSGVSFGEVVVNGLLYALALVLAVGALAVLLHGVGAFKEGFRRGSS